MLNYAEAHNRRTQDRYPFTLPRDLHLTSWQRAGNALKLTSWQVGGEKDTPKKLECLKIKFAISLKQKSPAIYTCKLRMDELGPGVQPWAFLLKASMGKYIYHIYRTTNECDVIIID